MAEFTETYHAGAFILSEANGNRSRDNIIISSGCGVVLAGTVVGRHTVGGKWSPSPASFSTDSGGSEVGKGITIQQVDATSADVAVAAITRNAEVNKYLLTYHSSVLTTDGMEDKNDELATFGIIVR
jgi:hypothetical protein